MRALIQRVCQASVVVDRETIGSIRHGFLVLLGVQQGDTDSDLEYVFNKTVGLRIFSDSAGKMNFDLAACGGAMLVISQFTLLADTRKGKRPSFNEAACGELAKSMYEQFIQRSQAAGIPTATGKFAADMDVHLINDGPVTIMIDSRNR